MLKIDALETGYGKKQVLFGLSPEVRAGETVGSQPHRWWQCGTQINLPEDHLQKLHDCDSFVRNLRNLLLRKGKGRQTVEVIPATTVWTTWFLCG